MLNKLGASFLVQFLSYAGIFFALMIANRTLSPTDFGIYAGISSISTLLATMLALGTDKTLFTLAARQHWGRSYPLSRPIAYQIAMLGGALILVTITCFILFEAGVINLALALGGALVVITAAKLAVGAYLRGMGYPVISLTALFSPQAAFLAPSMAGLASLGSPWVHNVDVWLAAAAAIELAITAFLFALLWQGRNRETPRPSLSNALGEARRGHRWRLHLSLGLSLSLWALLGQNSLFSVLIAGLIYSPDLLGHYTLAFRFGQLVLLPWISGTNLLLLPFMHIAANQASEAEIHRFRMTSRLILALCAAGTLAFALAANWLVPFFFPGFTPLAYEIALVLMVGNVALAAMGIGDQGLVAMGRAAEARTITLITALLMAVGIMVVIATSAGPLWLAISTTAALILRQYLSFRAVQRRVAIRISPI